MHISAEEIKENWTTLIDFINTTFDGDRKSKLIKLYTDLEDQIIMAPASSNVMYHNCFPGGYVKHVLHVLDCTKDTFEMWKARGAKMNYTEEEVWFAALNHDLGKVGDDTGAYYMDNPSQWHREKLGKMYETNDGLNYMSVPERGLYLLSQYGIGMSQCEWLSILLHDGMYVEENKKYFVHFKDGNRLKYNLPILLHHADMMASQIEYEQNTSGQTLAISKAKSTSNRSSDNKTSSDLDPSALKGFFESVVKT